MVGRRRKRPLLSQAQFDALVMLAPGFTTEQRQVAERVMVAGQTMAGAGKPLGWSRQRVHHAVRRLDKLAEACQQAAADRALPANWEKVVLAGPPELVAKWQAEAVRAAARAKKGEEKNPGQ